MRKPVARVVTYMVPFHERGPRIRFFHYVYHVKNAARGVLDIEKYVYSVSQWLIKIRHDGGNRRFLPWSPRQTTLQFLRSETTEEWGCTYVVTMVVCTTYGRAFRRFYFLDSSAL